jgi:hypothetical protein
MKIQLKILTELGSFNGLPFDVSEEQYEVLIKKSSSYYEDGGFEMIDEEKNLLIISPEIVKRSILKIDVVKDVQE